MERKVDQHSAPADKIALFRALFRGREDVYPRRFESCKTGRSGYSPACANEWARDLCKDALLQENGYFVLRFLAEDVGRQLDAILDAILRTLARQTEKTNRQD